MVKNKLVVVSVCVCLNFLAMSARMKQRNVDRRVKLIDNDTKINISIFLQA